MHVDDVGQRPQPVQGLEDPAAPDAVGHRDEEVDRQGGEDDVVDAALDVLEPLERLDALDLVPAGADRRPDGHDNQGYEQRDGDAGTPADESLDRQVVRRLALDLVDDGGHLDGDVGEVTTGKALRDPPMELGQRLVDLLGVEPVVAVVPLLRHGGQRRRPPGIPPLALDSGSSAMTLPVRGVNPLDLGHVFRPLCAWASTQPRERHRAGSAAAPAPVNSGR